MTAVILAAQSGEQEAVLRFALPILTTLALLGCSSADSTPTAPSPSPSMSAAARTMSDEERNRAVETIVSESEPVQRRYTDEDGLAFELSTNLASAKAEVSS